MYRKAVRSHSMPGKFVLPSEEMGEYEGPSRRRSAPARPAGGGLFPLTEEGTYGAPPLPPPPPYKKRERKPKVYSSYAVDNKCDVHSKKLARSEKDHGEVEVRRRRPSWSGSRRSSASPAPPTSRRTVSASPSRATSTDRSSASPEPPRTARKSSLGKTTSFGGTSWAPDPARRSRRYSSSSGVRYNDLRDSSFEENEEYEYEENQRKVSNASSSTGFSRNSYASSSLRSSSVSTSGSGRPPIRNITNTSSSRYGNHVSNKASSGHSGRPAPASILTKRDSTYSATGRKNSEISLEALRKPKIDSWDSMGILGLTTKIWNDTKKRQETFMQSTGHFLREENYGSYVM